MNFSIYIPSFPKAAPASLLVAFQASSISSSQLTICIPFPPPPAVALSIIGYFIFLAIFFASARDSKIPSEPGIVGTPAFSMVILALALSPIPSIISGLAPMNLIPFSAQTLEKVAFSERNP